MKKEIVKLYCDICKKECPKFIQDASETVAVCYLLRKKVWYGVSNNLDICKDCHSKIVSFMEEITSEQGDE